MRIGDAMGQNLTVNGALTVNGNVSDSYNNTVGQWGSVCVGSKIVQWRPVTLACGYGNYVNAEFASA